MQCGVEFPRIFEGGTARGVVEHAPAGDRRWDLAECLGQSRYKFRVIARPVHPRRAVKPEIDEPGPASWTVGAWRGRRMRRHPRNLVPYEQRIGGRREPRRVTRLAHDRSVVPGAKQIEEPVDNSRVKG